MYSRGLNIGPGDFHIHIKTKSSDDVSMFRNVQVVIALEKTGGYMCGKQCDLKKKIPPPFIHLLNTY